MSSSTTSDAASKLRIALCQFPVTDEKDLNHRTASEYLERAAQQGAQMVVLPEIWNSPYATAAFPEYAEELPSHNSGETTPINTEDNLSPSVALLWKHAIQHNLWIVGGSIPERTADGKIYNTCLVFNPQGEIVAKHRKVHLFDINVPGGIRFFESDTLSPGQTLSYFATPWGNLGLGICYDIRFPEYAMLLSQNYNVKVLIYPGAFNMTTGPAHWELLQRARALDNQCFVVTASPSRVVLEEEDSSGQRKYPHYTAWGHSTAVSPWGDIVATTDETAGIVMADLDLSKVDEVRKSIPIQSQKRTDMYKLDRVE